MTNSNVRGAAAKRVHLWTLLVACLLVLPLASVSAQTPVYQTDLGAFNLGPMIPVPVRLQNGERVGAIAYMFGGWGCFRAELAAIGPGWCRRDARRLHRMDSVHAAGSAGTSVGNLQLGDGDGDGDTDLIAVSLTSPYPYLVVNLDVRQCR